ncbi:molecular chaperone DnaJ [archaeon]|jgi:molecular chaperone DnaJ|nr:molecular chaperone DnaJ [archaeon]MBT3450628.1 molecular chaperone DnaJ [archaeon]MBT6868686.1 molecular chaperone DnaJ [archaeon]MBT7193474.1 molecular chaperone DnaJ [archaeon]MBT7381065.1 molecular chaperone DnaJ [archaeon]
MANKDYYKTLEVDKNATKSDVKKAFKKKAMKYHPDRAPEDKKVEYEEKFKEINEAASVLGDDKKRQQYDQFGSASFNSAGGAPGGHQGFDFSDIMSQFRSGSFGDFDDIFDSLFGGNGGSRRNARARRGNNLAYEIEISLEEASTGIKKTLDLNKLENCSDCQGKGATEFKSCHHCNGSGYVRKTQRTPFGLFQQTAPCPYCHGKGELPQDSCDGCNGEGLVRKRKKIEVKIPGGVENGMKLRVPNEGEAGMNSGPNGDLYVIVYVKEHKYFERSSQDLKITVPISFTTATLGGEIEVPTITGKAKLKIPSGTQSETVFKMRDKGLPFLRFSGTGDQLVKVRIEVPKKLTKKQKELIEKLGEKEPSKSFFKKVFG